MKLKLELSSCLQFLNCKQYLCVKLGKDSPHSVLYVYPCTRLHRSFSDGSLSMIIKLKIKGETVSKGLFKGDGMRLRKN
jgi:hypothetical protein